MNECHGRTLARTPLRAERSSSVAPWKNRPWRRSRTIRSKATTHRVRWSMSLLAALDAAGFAAPADGGGTSRRSINSTPAVSRRPRNWRRSPVSTQQAVFSMSAPASADRRATWRKAWVAKSSVSI